MTDDDVRAAYGARADEYTALLGEVSDAEAPDIARIGAWADAVAGPVLDAGCGPGHWTDFLARRDLAASGVDLTPAFVALATARFPDVRFRVGSMDSLDAADGSFGAVLAWYSLIHREPATMPAALAELARVVRPGGSLLVGFFTADRRTPYAHAVAPAWLWPVAELAEALEDAGFRTEDAETRERPGKPSHASISARRR